MKVRGGFLNNNKNVGFVEITEIENAKRICLHIKEIKRILKLMSVLGELGYESVYITIDDKSPMIVGGKKFGIAIAPSYCKGDENED